LGVPSGALGDEAAPVFGPIAVAELYTYPFRLHLGSSMPPPIITGFWVVSVAIKIPQPDNHFPVYII
jgi:hypothetical protein